MFAIAFFAVIALMVSGKGISSIGSSEQSLHNTLAQRSQCHTTEQQQQAAAALIRLSGYDCSTVDDACAYVLSEGFTVYCNHYRYEFELENHGGKWSVKAD